MKEITNAATPIHPQGLTHMPEQLVENLGLPDNLLRTEPHCQRLMRFHLTCYTNSHEKR